MFGGSSKLQEEGTCSLYLYATEWGGLRVAPALPCQSLEDSGSSAGVESWLPGGLTNYKSKNIYVSSQEDGKSGDSATEREVAPSAGFSPCGIDSR